MPSWLVYKILRQSWSQSVRDGWDFSQRFWWITTFERLSHSTWHTLLQSWRQLGLRWIRRPNHPPRKLFWGQQWLLGGHVVERMREPGGSVRSLSRRSGVRRLLGLCRRLDLAVLRERTVLFRLVWHRRRIGLLHAWSFLLRILQRRVWPMRTSIVLFIYL